MARVVASLVASLVSSSLATLLATLLAILLGVGTPARASVVEALDLARLVEESDDVVLVRVIKHWSLYDEHGRIVTDYQVHVERAEKGGAVPGSALIVRQLGGIVGELGMRVAGEPSFRDGELVLLFGQRGEEPFLRPVGMSQGAMRVFDKDGERWVRSSSAGMKLVDLGRNKSRSQGTRAGPQKLDALLAEVSALVEAQR